MLREGNVVRITDQADFQALLIQEGRNVRGIKDIFVTFFSHLSFDEEITYDGKQLFGFLDVTNLELRDRPKFRWRITLQLQQDGNRLSGAYSGERSSGGSGWSREIQLHRISKTAPRP